jgi:hypothetical protein
MSEPPHIQIIAAFDDPRGASNARVLLKTRGVRPARIRAVTSPERLGGRWAHCGPILATGAGLGMGLALLFAAATLMLFPTVLSPLVLTVVAVPLGLAVGTISAFAYGCMSHDRPAAPSDEGTAILIVEPEGMREAEQVERVLKNHPDARDVTRQMETDPADGLSRPGTDAKSQ